MEMNKLYFRSIDDTFCETLKDIVDDAKLEGLTEIKVHEAVPTNDTSMGIWCSWYGEALDKDRCRKSECSFYSSKSGRGKCQHRGQLYLYGEEETIILLDLDYFINKD